MRIVYNFNSGRRRLPTVHELTVKTGKARSDVIAALDALITFEYIHWDRSDTSKIIILEDWERESEKPVLDEQEVQLIEEAILNRTRNADLSR
ncbi:hypothetical protein [Paenibacillus sp. PCH8]|uniref:hypothetical protein n=1 Tax=Paenibacillus sp. PCH8 TaxID=2066524 RepID=UPI0015E35C94|nr:hypothetical protein [Paenibacillus sp. PCH8]